MTTAVRRALAVVLALHGAIHLMGVAQGFGWAEVSTLTTPVGDAEAVLWLVAAVLVLVVAVMLWRGSPAWWWAVAAAAAVASQAAIATSWHDARAGTVANLLLLAAASYAAWRPDRQGATATDRAGTPVTGGRAR